MGQYQGQDVIIKSGKYGAYIAWGTTNLSLKPLLQAGGGGGCAPTIAAAGGKYAHKSKTTTNQKSEFDLTLEDVIKFIERNSAVATPSSTDASDEPTASAPATYIQGQILRTLDENTTIRYGRYGPYIFHKTQKMTKPAFIALKGFAELHGNYITCDATILREWIAVDAAAPAKPKPKFGFFKKK